MGLWTGDAFSPDDVAAARSLFQVIGVPPSSPQPSALRPTDPAWSPEGDRIVVAVDVDADGPVPAQLHVVPATGAPTGTNETGTRITDEPEGAFEPSWSPDGSSIAYTTGREIRIVDPNRPGVPRTLVSSFDEVRSPSWSPAGDALVFTGRGADGWDLYVTDLEGNLTRLTATPGIDEVDPCWGIRPPTEIHAEITATIDTGQEYPEGVAIGEGAVWVVTLDDDTESADLVRLDTTSGDTVARIPLPSYPGWEFGGAGITTGLGSVWVTGWSDAHPSGAVVHRIDPATNSLARTIDVGTGGAADLWVDGSGIWVLASRGPDSMRLYRLDPDTFVVVATVELPIGWSQSVFEAGGSIWVLGNTDDRNGAPAETLFRIDPETDTIVGRFEPAGGDPFFVTPSADLLWFFDGGLRAFDARSERLVVGPLPLPDRCCAGLVADGTGGVWVVSTGGGPVESGLWHVRPDGVVDAHASGNPGDEASGIAAAFDPATDTIWIVHHEQTVAALGVGPA
jgi:hypothetical protein